MYYCNYCNILLCTWHSLIEITSLCVAVEDISERNVASHCTAPSIEKEAPYISWSHLVIVIETPPGRK